MSPERPQIDKPEGDIPFDLGIEDIVVGDGDEATAGKTVSVHYAGVAFSTGEEFDASWNRNQPFEFKLGKGQVIPGWDAGVQGMKVGGRRKLTIPSAMAYGARGAGGVIAWGVDDVETSEPTGRYRDAYLEPFRGLTTGDLTDLAQTARRLGWVCRALNSRRSQPSDESTRLRLRMFLDGRV